MSHIPVLLHEVIDGLRVHEGMFVIDGTVNGGGHAEAMLQKIGATGQLLGIDWDGDLIEATRKRLGVSRNTRFVQGNYAETPDILHALKLSKADAMLLDIGLSSTQLEASGRGFSFMTKKAEPLAMTYDTTQTPVYELISKMREDEIAKVLYEFGEERFGKRIASAIYARERRDPIATNYELRDTVLAAVPKSYERGRIHPATRTFQAFRIYANGELENLTSILGKVSQVLVSGGRMAIISFHSLEDRIVKNGFRDMEKQGIAKVITKKPVIATEEEQRANPRSRSAKLRIIELI
ncbi:MAG: 16S rRNA (cytosine(1402)-N(4))-methyltransferase RsmH [Patescibacteria group bacterium]